LAVIGGAPDGKGNKSTSTSIMRLRMVLHEQESDRNLYHWVKYAREKIDWYGMIWELLRCEDES
jgi:hypothetical protein